MVASRRTAAAYGLVCVAGLGRALAQNTELVLEASTNEGQTWASEVSASPGTTVYVRMRVRLGNAGTETVLGLAGVTCQPTLTSWRNNTDALVPFTSTLSGVPEVPATNTGVIAPFNPPMFTAGGPMTGHADAGNVLRLAALNCLTLTTNLAWGISTGQVPASIGGTNFRGGTDAVVFRYAITLGNAGPREMIASVPIASILQGRGSWYRTPGGTNSLRAPIDPLESGIFPATIRVVPSVPGIVVMFAGMAAMRWTRRRS